MDTLISLHLILHSFFLFTLNLTPKMVTSYCTRDVMEFQSVGASYFFYQQPEYPRDCQEIRRKCSASNASGVYLIKPDGYPKPFEVFCDNSDESGGWTVIQRRFDGSVDFNRNWTEHLNGFGFLSSEFWLGNCKVSYLTNQKTYELQINMINFAGSSFYVNYKMFRISDDQGNYKIASFGEFSGNADDFVGVCPPNMVFDFCSCQTICSDPLTCHKTCVDDEETCICPNGFFIDEDNNCVSEQECNCFAADFGVVPEGGSYVNSNCSERCFCTNNQLNCENFQCDTEATCQELDNAYQCQCKEGFVGGGQTCIVERNATDCSDLYNAGITNDGIYTVYPSGWSDAGFDVYCDMSTAPGGWTIFQRRLNGSVDFYQTWTMYKAGFGAQSGEHWLGNDKLHIITNQKDYSLRIDLMDNARRSYYAQYNLFRIGDENNKYRLNSLGSYSGTAGYNSMNWIKGRFFSTHDRDNDASSYNCAQKHRGAWWYAYAGRYNHCSNWQISGGYRGCSYSNLNGDYTAGRGQNIFWYGLPGNDCNIQRTEMKLRPN